MAKKIGELIICFLLSGLTHLHCQSVKPDGNLIRINTDSGRDKGELYEIHDSAVSILKRKQDKILLFPVSEINQLVIKSKAPVLPGIAQSTLYTALFAELLITWVYIYNADHRYFAFNKGDPPYWRAFVYGYPLGPRLDLRGKVLRQCLSGFVFR
jgi:hypothetical protein